MAEAAHNPERSAAREAATTPSWLDRMPLLVWIGTSLAFLGALAFDSVTARIWVYGRLTFQDRGIAHVWRYFGDRLPELPGGPLFPILFYVCLALLVAGTVAGLALFLVSDDGASAAPDPGKAGAVDAE